MDSFRSKKNKDKDVHKLSGTKNRKQQFNFYSINDLYFKSQMF